MLNLLKADLKLLIKNKLLIVSAFVYLFFFIFMFFQKAFNINSGFFQKDILTPYYLIVFNLALLCVTNNFFMSIVGGIVGGESYENNTVSIYALHQGRHKFIFVKILCFFSFSAITSVFIAIIGFVEGVIIIRDFSDMNIVLILKFCIIGFLINALNGIFAFLLSFLFKKIFIGVFFSIVGGFLLSFFSQYVKIFSNLLSKDYIYVILSDTFTILSDKSDTQLVIKFSSSSNSLLLSYLICILIIFSCIGIVFLISRKREYSV
ncbi:MAG: hypothetical protein LBM93_04220 [Oscillospiraceae bacterium]|jgi:ABC-type transport system involved in multi-copper enzyme maturation permease subunit|nr:hypothetical protein [Oscillospiraceae bacterium]